MSCRAGFALPPLLGTTQLKALESNSNISQIFFFKVRVDKPLGRGYGSSPFPSMATHQHGDWDSLTSVSPSTPLLFGFPLIAEKQLQLFPDIILLVTALGTCKLHDCGCRKKPALPLDTLRRADYPRFFFCLQMFQYLMQ